MKTKPNNKLAQIYFCQIALSAAYSWFQLMGPNARNSVIKAVCIKLDLATKKKPDAFMPEGLVKLFHCQLINI